MRGTEDVRHHCISMEMMSSLYIGGERRCVGVPLLIQVVKGYPIVILTWEGTDPKLPSVVLNSHMDVVPVYAVSRAVT